jgi:outer membrane murein-binding lipoprotein Lpp
MEELTKVVTDIKAQFDAFTKDAEARVNGNKAAGARARKVSLEIEKLAKQFRKASIEADKAATK